MERTMERIKVLLVISDEQKRQEISSILGSVEYISVSGEVDSGEEAVSFLESNEVNVVLLEAAIAGDGYKISEKITAEDPELIVIIIEDILKEETLRKGIFSGAKDVLIYPVSPSKLVDSIYKCFQKEKQKEKMTKKAVGAKKTKHRGQIISVFSNKGGVGKTLFAANLAVSFAQNEKSKVALVDLDLEYGNCALNLNLIPHYTISDVINDIRNLDSELMESYMIPHRSGVKLLAPCAQAQLSEFIDSDHIAVILKVLRRSFDFVILDMPSRMSSKLEPAFQEADNLVILVDQNITSIQNVKALLNSLSSLNYQKNKIKVVVNKFDPKREIKIKDMEATLKHEVSVVIPYDYKLACTSVNRGVPAVTIDSRSKVAKSFENCGKILTGSSPTGGLFRKRA